MEHITLTSHDLDVKRDMYSVVQQKELLVLLAAQIQT